MIVLKLHFRTKNGGIEFNVTGPLDVVQGEPAAVNQILWGMRAALKDHYERLGCTVEFDIKDE